MEGVSKRFEKNAVLQPKRIIIHRKPHFGFGFTLRHFIAFPPEQLADSMNLNPTKAMETIFIKEVNFDGPAYLAGLQTGDRVLTVNSMPVAGVPYSNIVGIIKQTPSVLQLEVVPKECDVLQMYYTDIAHNPETNRQKANLLKLSHNSHKSHSETIPDKTKPHIPIADKNGIEAIGYPQDKFASPILNNPLGTNDFVIRLKKSIEQKENFLKHSHHPMLLNSQIQSDFGTRFNFPERSHFRSQFVSNKVDQLNSFRNDSHKDRDKISKFMKNENPMLMSIQHKSINDNISLQNNIDSLKKTYEFPRAKPKLEIMEKKIDDLRTTSEQTKWCEAENIYEETIEKNVLTKKTEIALEPIIKEFLPSTSVIRRYKPIAVSEDIERPMRRISYLRATGNELNYNAERFPSAETLTGKTSEILEEKEAQIDKPDSSLKEVDVQSDSVTEIIEADMETKLASIKGQRCQSRSWRSSKLTLQGNILKVDYRSTKAEHNTLEFDVSKFNISDNESTKRKFVFALKSKAFTVENSLPVNEDDFCMGTQIFFQARNAGEYRKWLSALQSIKLSDEPTSNKPSETHGVQLAEPQKIAGVAKVQTNVYCEDLIQEYSSSESTSARCGGEINMHFSQSTVIKSKKVSCNLDSKEMGSPKTKNWKDLLFRKIQGTTSDVFPSSFQRQSTPITGTIGVPLKSCPMSKENKFVPYLVDLCTKIVESKGMSVVGIYRIPGNKAAISDLKELVNRSEFLDDEKVKSDPRWEDVNVISSLLKLFIRSLPDGLLPPNLYNKFIDADKLMGEKRYEQLKILLDTLPVYSYETLKHIVRHLNRISENCAINLMEPKNLAIIFGPSIIRTSNETLEIAVKDMKHQCRIVELLVSQYGFFFENDSLAELVLENTTGVNAIPQPDQTHLLLDNVSKIEQICQDKESTGSRFIPHLRRRIQHRKRNVTTSINSDTYSGESVISLESSKKIIDQHSEEISNGGDEHDSVGATVVSDDEYNNDGISDTGSMSLTSITDTLENKIRNLRKTSINTDQSDSINKLSINLNDFQQPITINENIPYADESPERIVIPSDQADCMKIVSRIYSATPLTIYNRDINKNINNNNNNNNNISINNQPYTKLSYVYDDYDSEVSTTSDPKDSLNISPQFMDRYKKRRDYRLFRSASFNCRNYSGRAINNQSVLTKDEKTDMNITKKRQIQNKQIRSIKRRHTVGGTHDYSATITRRSNNEHILEVGIRIKNRTK